MANIYFQLPIQIFRVKSTKFNNTDVEFFVKRTSSKFERYGIEFTRVGSGQRIVSDHKLALVDQDNVKQLLSWGSPIDGIRIFFVKANLLSNQMAWSFDPLDTSMDESYQGAVFVTDKCMGFNEQRAELLGYDPSFDILMQKLGHILLQQKDMIQDREIFNFFHEINENCNDKVSVEQLKKIYTSSYLKKLAA